MEREHGILKTGKILRLFRQRLLTMDWDGVDERGAATVPECLSKAEKDVTALYMSLRDQSKNPGYCNYYHVTVTPTRIMPDGPFPDQVRLGFKDCLEVYSLRNRSQTGSFVDTPRTPIASFASSSQMRMDWIIDGTGTFKEPRSCMSASEGS